MIREIIVPAKECTCDLCTYSWRSLQAKKPTACPRCGSRQWNGQKRPSHVNEIKFPSPRKVGRPKTMPQLEEEL
jgi:hypothetical protein